MATLFITLPRYATVNTLVSTQKPGWKEDLRQVFELACIKSLFSSSLVNAQTYVNVTEGLIKPDTLICSSHRGARGSLLMSHDLLQERIQHSGILSPAQPFLSPRRCHIPSEINVRGSHCLGVGN